LRDIARISQFLLSKAEKNYFLRLESFLPETSGISSLINTNSKPSIVIPTERRNLLIFKNAKHHSKDFPHPFE
jgi:hypothetical protein